MKTKNFNSYKYQDLLFSLYLIEKAFFFNNQLNLSNIDELIGLDSKAFDKKIFDIYIKLFLKFEKTI